MLRREIGLTEKDFGENGSLPIFCLSFISQFVYEYITLLIKK